MSSPITVGAIDRHRNGISGEPFYVVHFEDPDNGAMMAVVFPPEQTDDGDPDWGIYERGEWDNPRIAVFQESKLPDTRFGQNSWRGDNYARDLYKAIAEHDLIGTLEDHER